MSSTKGIKKSRTKSSTYLSDYEKYLVHNSVHLSPLGSGYEWYGSSLEEIAERIRQPTNERLPLTDWRRKAIALYSFAIPNAQALKVIASNSPLLEVGCGTGYWAYELIKLGAGVDIVATDPHPYKDYALDYGSSPHYIPIDFVKANKAISKYSPNGERTLFMCWPEMDSWTEKALKQYRKQGGKTLCLVGEYRACTATDEFFDELEKHWDETETVSIPQWKGIHDYLSVHKVKL